MNSSDLSINAFAEGILNEEKSIDDDMAMESYGQIVYCYNEHFSNIVLTQRWTREMISNSQFRSRALSPSLKSDLQAVYEIYEGQKTFITYGKVQFWEKVHYTVRQDTSFVRVHLAVGDNVELKTKDNHGKVFAKVVGLFKHIGDDLRQRVFLVLRWYQPTGKKHPLLGCEIYQLEPLHYNNRLAIQPITVIDHPQFTTSHFISMTGIGDKYIINDFLWIPA
jgi:hypothetical protein